MHHPGLKTMHHQYNDIRDLKSTATFHNFELELLKRISYYSRLTGYAFVKNKTLAEKFECSISTVKRILKHLKDSGEVYSVQAGGRRALFTKQNYPHRDVFFEQYPIAKIGKFVSKNYSSYMDAVAKNGVAYRNPEINKILHSKFLVSEPVIFERKINLESRKEEILVEPPDEPPFDPPFEPPTYGTNLPVDCIKEPIFEQKNRANIVECYECIEKVVIDTPNTGSAREAANHHLFSKKTNQAQAQAAAKKKQRPVLPRIVMTETEMEALYRCYPAHKDQVDKRINNAKVVLDMIERSNNTSRSAIYAMGEYKLAKKYIEEWKQSVDAKKSKEDAKKMEEVFYKKNPEELRMEYAKKVISNKPWLERYMRIDVNSVSLIMPHLRPIISTLPAYSVYSHDQNFECRLDDLINRIEEFHLKRPREKNDEIWKRSFKSNSSGVVRYSHGT